MLISIFTPSHDPAFLKETWESVKSQTHQDFEWVVLCNGKTTKKKVREIVGGDVRVRAIKYLGESRNIGALKRAACMACTGEFLVELDHDDLLMPTALEEIAKASKEHPEACFFYSNFADFLPNGAPSTFSPQFGWKYRDHVIDGKFYKEAIAWEPTAASVSLIFYAPNHFRAWRRKEYLEMGGHNPTLEVADDHELVVRTYLHGRMHHIDKLLYLYRIGENNTWSKKSELIDMLTRQFFDVFIERLVAKENQLAGTPIYDLGGAFNNPPGWTPVDRTAPGIQADLTKRWPFEDSSVGAFRAHDFLEHLPDKQFTMSEIYRCLKPGGWLLSCTPSALGQGGACDPTHVSMWVKRSFKYYTEAEIAKYIGNDGKMRFMEARLWEGYPSPAHEAEDLRYVKADLIALKPGMERLPGLINI